MADRSRKDKLVHMLIEDIDDVDSFFKVTIPNTETKIARIFTISKGNIEGINMVSIVRKYISLEWTVYPSTYGYKRTGRSSKKNAKFLNLQNPEQYTGHCFRRSSASLLADAGVDLLTLKRHGGLKSSSVAENYVEQSIENKKEISMKMLGHTTTHTASAHINMEATTSTFCQNVLRTSSKVSGLLSTISDATFKKCTVNIYNK